MKEYCIIQSGSPADLSKVVQENLDQGWEPHGGLIHYTEQVYLRGSPCLTDWFLQPIVRDKPTDSSRSVRECSTDLYQRLLICTPQPHSNYTQISTDLLKDLLTHFKRVSNDRT